jgi:hypothetical protein
MDLGSLGRHRRQTTNGKKLPNLNIHQNLFLTSR